MAFLSGMECRRHDTTRWFRQQATIRFPRAHDALRARRPGDWRQRVRTKVLLAGRQLAECCAGSRALVGVKYRPCQLGTPDGGRMCMERRAPTSRWQVVAERRRSTVATSDGQTLTSIARRRTRATDATAAPSVSTAAKDIRFEQVRQHRSQVAARDERSVAAVTHCQFVVGYGGG